MVRRRDVAVKVNGVWRYVYRAIDQHGQVKSRSRDAGKDIAVRKPDEDGGGAAHLGRRRTRIDVVIHSLVTAHAALRDIALSLGVGDHEPGEARRLGFRRLRCPQNTTAAGVVNNAATTRQTAATIDRPLDGRRATPSSAIGSSPQHLLRTAGAGPHRNGPGQREVSRYRWGGGDRPDATPPARTTSRQELNTLVPAQQAGDMSHAAGGQALALVFLAAVLVDLLL
jgi:hypothetical protein